MQERFELTASDYNPVTSPLQPTDEAVELLANRPEFRFQSLESLVASVATKYPTLVKHIPSVPRAGKPDDLTSARRRARAVAIALLVGTGHGQTSGNELDATLAAKTILLVDNESAVRAATAKRLEGAGYNVEQASDQASAMRLLATGRISVVVVSLYASLLGRYDGAALCSEIAETMPKQKIVVCTGGSDHYIPPAIQKFPRIARPFQYGELLSTLRKVV